MHDTERAATNLNRDNPIQAVQEVIEPIKKNETRNWKYHLTNEHF